MQRALPKGVTLPRYVVFKSDNGHYLSSSKEEGKFYGSLNFNSPNPLNPFTKFEIEPATTASSFVNIKSSYSNKYWTPRKDWYTNSWIGAVADQPNEDCSSLECTLFEPFYNQETNSLKLRHVHLDKYVYTFTERYSDYYGYIYANRPVDPNANPCYKIEDWETFMILPKYVVFKGNDGNYLRATELNHENFLQFSGTDIGDLMVMHEIKYYREGDFQLKAVGVGKFWDLYDKGWLKAKTENYTMCQRFDAVKINDNTMALRTSNNGSFFKILRPVHFCQRLTRDGVSDCLNANSSNMIKETYLRIMEPVVSRSVYDVNFDLASSKIYNLKAQTVAKEFATNISNQPNTVTLKLSYTYSTSNRWDSSISLKVGMEMNLESGIPLLYDGEIKVFSEFTGSYSWGTTIESTKTLETSYQVTVPPRKKLELNVVATQGQCDIPFSYVKRDTLCNGETVTEVLEDGVYTSVNYYNFDYQSHDTSL